MTISEQDHSLNRERRQTFGVGLLKGMGVTLKHLFKHNTVVQYPDEKQDLSPRTRGVIALKEENCTVCMLCARECPDWCIYIDSHKETLPPKRAGGRPRKRNVLDRFAIDYALCMYCGICVEVCPYDALFWSREFEYSEFDIRELTHEKERLSDWMTTVLPPPPLEEGALLPGEPATAAGAAGPGSAQRPSPPSQATAAEERPEQAARAPEAATASAPPATRATPSQTQAGETIPTDVTAPPSATERRVGDDASEAGAAQAAEPTGAAGGQPEALRSAGERPPEESALTGERPASEASDGDQGAGAVAAVQDTPAPAAEAAPQPAPAATPPSAPAPHAPPVDGEAVYQRVLQEQLDRGSSPEVAEARAQVARTRAERGLGGTAATVQTPAVAPPPPSEEAAAAPGGGEPEPRATPPETAEQGPQPQASAEPPAGATEADASTTGATEAATPEGGTAPAASSEDPDAVYERVLQEERAKGSSDAVAVARAKAARVRAMKGTRGPS